MSNPKEKTKPRDDGYPDTFKEKLASGGTSLSACLRQEMQSQREELSKINESCKLSKSQKGKSDEPVSDELKEKMEEVQSISIVVLVQCDRK